MRAVIVLCLLGMACTEPNAAASCASGTCSDPLFPYCDVDGIVAGTPGKCIAVECTPGEVLTCSADEAVTCNMTGNGYERLACDLGCLTAPAPHCA